MDPPQHLQQLPVCSQTAALGLAMQQAVHRVQVRSQSPLGVAQQLQLHSSSLASADLIYISTAAVCTMRVAAAWSHQLKELLSPTTEQMMQRCTASMRLSAVGHYQCQLAAQQHAAMALMTLSAKQHTP